MTSTNDASAPSLEAIGICLSGGGFRAAGFHLGTLAYLNHVGLEDRIDQLSTISGGSFTGAKYTLSLVEHADFDDFFGEFYDFLDHAELVSDTLADLTGAAPPQTPSGRDDLIVSIANVYASTFLQQRAPGVEPKPYRFSSILDADDLRLTEVAFNATEFRNGLAFRFQRTKSGKIGNGKLFIDREDAEKIRIADIVAASSAFPGGFEPLSFPYDFHWPGDGAVPPALKEQFEKDDGGKFPVALMDGGIYDNQGLDSLLLAGERMEAGDGRVFIISDVAARNDDLYPFPEQKKGDRGPTLGRLSLYAYALFFAAVVSFVVVLAHALIELSAGELNLIDIFLYVIPALVTLGVAVALWWARKIFFDDVVGRFPDVGGAAWKDLKKLRLRQTMDMVDLRITSLFALASDVFMKRIRSLVDTSIYADVRYEGRRIANYIYHLVPGNDWPPKKIPEGSFDEVQKWSPDLQNVAYYAATLPSTLWFDHEYELPCLVAAGQATMCFNLMKWICRNHNGDPDQYPEDLKALWDRLLEDWERLCEDPYALLAEGMGEGRRPPP